MHAASGHHQTSVRQEDLTMPHVRESSSDAIIAAGTSAGEMLAWRLHSGCCSERAFSGTLVNMPGNTPNPNLHALQHLLCSLFVVLNKIFHCHSKSKCRKR